MLKIKLIAIELKIRENEREEVLDRRHFDLKLACNDD